MYNRAEIVDQNFLNHVKSGELPPARTHVTWDQSLLPKEVLIDLFESQMTSRLLDLRARELKNTGHCYYTIGSSGHEGNAVFGQVFRRTDMAFLHYRSAAFMLQRYKQDAAASGIKDLLLSFMASKDDPIAGGRHKVFGSKEFFVPPQTSTIASHLPKAVGAALSIARAKDLKIAAKMPENSVVLCSFGDASVNHSVAQGAFNTAALISYQYMKLPLVFICEDNHIGISVPTSDHWVEDNFKHRPRIKYLPCDGLHLIDIYEKAKEAERLTRTRGKPVFIHMDTVRLLGHAGSDVETNYHSLGQIETAEANDPLLHSARLMIENSLLSKEEILQRYTNLRQEIKSLSEALKDGPHLMTAEEIGASIIPHNVGPKAPVLPVESAREELLGREYKNLKTPQHMAKLINWGLSDELLRYPNAVILGEDVAQKGGVYHVTDNLFKRFGVKRVFNSPLDETSILGTAIGLAHNGFLPIPEIQFLAYYHNAEDQLRGEASTLSFFSDQQFTNPLVVRIAGLAYQKGFGGHFHNDNSLAVLRDLPGVTVGIPSNGADAVKMLRACVREAHENGRVSVMLEPIALYMTKDLHEAGDKLWSFEYPQPGEECAFGELGIYGESEDLVIITYGNGVYYSLQAKKNIEEQTNKKVKVIDLKWLPFDAKKLATAVGNAKNVLVVDECRKTGGPNEAIVASLVENMHKLPRIKIYAAGDCFIPLGPAATVLLPSREGIVERAVELLSLTW